MSDKKTIYYTTQIYRNTQQDFRGHSLYQHQFFRKQKYTTFLSNYTQYYSSYYKIAESVNDTDTVWLQLLTLHVMAPGWILVRKSLEQTLQSRLKYNLPAQEAVSSCHSAVTPWSWGKNPYHDLWAFPTTLHLSETQNCSLLAGTRGPRSAHHSETPGAEHSPTIPPQPPLLKPSGLWMGTNEPQVRKAHCACGRREGHGWAAFLFCLSHGTTAIAPWCHGASLVLLKHVSMSHHICSCLFMFREFSPISALRPSRAILSFLKTFTNRAYILSMSQCSLQSYPWKSQGDSLHLCTYIASQYMVTEIRIL